MGQPRLLVIDDEPALAEFVAQVADEEPAAAGQEIGNQRCTACRRTRSGRC